jgi:hypothetical protein
VRLRALALGAAAALAGCGSGEPGGDFGAFTDCASVGRPQAVGDPAGDAPGAPPSGDLVGAALARGDGRLCATFTTRERAASGSAFVLELRPRQDPVGPLVALEVTLLGGEPPEVRLRSADAGEARGTALPGATVGSRGSRLSLVVPLEAITGATDRAVAQDPGWAARVLGGDGRERWADATLRFGA